MATSAAKSTPTWTASIPPIRAWCRRPALARGGAGVMPSLSIEFAKKFDVPLQVRSSFSDAEGTWIVPEADWMAGVAACGAALCRAEARIVIENVPDQPGISHRIFSAIADRNIVVDMIAQNVGSA